MFSNMSWSSSIICSVLLLTTSTTRAEIRSFQGIFDADSSYIHYTKGFLITPGSIDLSQLVFTASVGTDLLNDHDDVVGNQDDDNGNRFLMDAKDTNEAGSTVDIVVFNEPDSCSNTPAGCSWAGLGIGSADDTAIQWCCSSDAVDLGYCSASQLDRLIVNATLFQGQHRFVDIPPSGDFLGRVKYGLLEETSPSGQYVLVFANCKDTGRAVQVSGDYIWNSVHGYLPGDLFGEMYFFGMLTILYLLLTVWYGVTMSFYEAIQIQQWIMGTLVLGLAETFFRTGDYFVWNEDGRRFWFALYTGIFLGVVKRGLSRVLVLMVSLGWGVVRDRLDNFYTIVVLGLLYVGTAAARDITTVFAVTDNQILSIKEENQLFDVVTVITFVVAAIDVTFYLWILDALNGTMQYLENMNQIMKLTRYLRLRCVLLFSILFAVVWSIFSLVSTHNTILPEQQQWAVGAFMELNYLFVLVAVAYLWRPSPNAKNLAFVMELPALGGNDDEENELEMVENIPSALDDDEDYGYQDGEKNDEEFKVDKGVST